MDEDHSPYVLYGERGGPEVEEAHPFTGLIGGGEPHVKEDELPHFFEERRASSHGGESLRKGCPPKVEEDSSFTYLRIGERL